MERTAQWLAARGLRLRRTGTARDYAVALDGIEGVEARLMSAGEIAGALAAGEVNLGVTGRDLIREGAVRAEEVAALGFGHADLVIAVPDFWSDCRTLHDLDAVAAQFREGHGRRLRIATKYHRLTRAALREAGVADYVLVDSQGATEGTVAGGGAEAIADITSTGETLRANHLRVLEDGMVLRSEACLWRSQVDGGDEGPFRDLAARAAG
ncbi:ATP phosphoribosyltransferase [Hasllibacter halocynthiae]|nr:ATP phosphoribosyltransferase [Hasllibacter halocynthiae]